MLGLIFDNLFWLICGLSTLSVSLVLPRSVPFRRGFLFILIAVSAFSFGVLYGNQSKAELRATVKALKAQDEALRQMNRALNAQALNRAENARKVRDTLHQYEKELNNGKAKHCVSDPVYDRRLRSILDSLPTR